LGDFKGYTEAGNLVLQGENIYRNPKINTWPPFFSLLCVPLALADQLNPYLIRFIWLSGSIVAMYFVMQLTIQLVIKRKLTIYSLKKDILINTNALSIMHPVILIPLLIIVRFILENLANIQINIFMLLFALLSLYYFIQKKAILAALFLAFSISIKVYTIFLLLYFIFKREYKVVGYGLLFLIIFGLSPILVFGAENTVDYYRTWYNMSLVPFASAGHKNQSYFAMMHRVLMDEPSGSGQFLSRDVPGLIPDLKQLKMVAYGIVAIIALFIAYAFRKKLEQRDSLQSLIEYVFVLNIIPILSPLAWKAYFIFLFPSYFLNVLFIFHASSTLSKQAAGLLKISFYCSVILTVFSSELFVGKHFSDVLESFSIITIGSALAALNLYLIYMNKDKFKTDILEKNNSTIY
jgi:hypothetical protein